MYEQENANDHYKALEAEARQRAIFTTTMPDGSTLTGTAGTTTAADGLTYGIIKWEDGISTFQRTEDGKLVVLDAAEQRTRTGNTPTCEDCDQPIDRCMCEEIETEFAGMTGDTVKLISELDGDSRRREMARVELQRRSIDDIDDSQDRTFDDEFSGDRDDEVGTPHR